MSKKTNYTITTLKKNLTQISKPVFSQASNTTLGIRNSYTPYTVVRTGKGDIEDNETFPKFPFGQFEPYGIYSLPSASYTFENSSSSGYCVNQSTNSALTGALTCSAVTGADPAWVPSCSPPVYDSGRYCGPLAGTYSMHFFGHADTLSGSYIQLQNIDESPTEGWGFLRGSWSYSVWFKPYSGQLSQGALGMFGQHRTTRPYDFYNVANWAGFGVNLGRQSAYYLQGAIKLLPTASWNASAGGCVYGYESDATGNSGGVQMQWTNGVWNHLVVQVSGSEGDGNRFVRTFLNGIKLNPRVNLSYDTAAYALTGSNGEFLWPATASLNPDYKVLIGPFNPGSSNGHKKFSGSMDSITIWDKFLSAEQINSIWESSGSLASFKIGEAVRKKT